METTESREETGRSYRGASWAIKLLPGFPSPLPSKSTPAALADSGAYHLDFDPAGEGKRIARFQGYRARRGIVDRFSNRDRHRDRLSGKGRPADQGQAIVQGVSRGSDLPGGQT